MGYNFTIGVSEGGKLCTGCWVCAVVFCVKSFPIYEMEEILPNGTEKLPIDGIGGALDKN